ncbi:hypothetical protein FQV43_05930 [Corynebacterium sp. sy039]|nr:hypothetical protein FQV43_05930 [Corynebacterium sp. sy039]
MDGPTSGVVKLPNYLDWHSNKGYDLDAGIPRIKTLYRTVLREALKVEDLKYLNHTLLRQIWGSIRIPPVLRELYETKFPELRDVRHCS